MAKFDLKLFPCSNKIKRELLNLYGWRSLSKTPVSSIMLAGLCVAFKVGNPLSSLQNSHSQLLCSTVWTATLLSAVTKAADLEAEEADEEPTKEEESAGSIASMLKKRVTRV